MDIIGSIRKAVRRFSAGGPEAPPNNEECQETSKTVTDRPEPPHERTMTVGSDDVFEDQDAQIQADQQLVSRPVRRRSSFNQSLSGYRAELPSRDSQSRRFIVTPRSPYTHAWLDIHDFKNTDMKPTTNGQSHPGTPTATTPMQRLFVAPQRVDSIVLPFRPPLSTCYDEEQMSEEEASTAIARQSTARGSTVINMDRRCTDVTRLNEEGTIKSISRTSSISSENSADVPTPLDQSERWIDNLDAKNSVITAMTVFYALIMTIFALVLELSHLLSAETKRVVQSKDLIFGLYMYGMAVVFLFYCYFVLLLNPRWKTVIAKIKCLLKFQKLIVESTTESDENSSIAAATIHRKVSHDSPSAGSLFLRFGCVVFGVIGTVYYSFDVFLALTDSTVDKGNIALDVCAIVFIFTQMHFLFCNWKMTIMGHHTVARFGTMHLMAANLWTWIRYVLIEESVMDKEIREIFTPEAFNKDANQTSDMTFSHEVDSGEFEGADSGMTNEKLRMARSITRDCTGGADCILGSITDIMYTSIVEYSLIGAAVMFIVWRNIDHVRQTPTAYVKRKHQIRVDCSKTTTGLFCGLAFLAATFTSMAVFYGYSLNKRNHTAAFVFSITDIIQYVIASLACIYALWQMRLLRYHHTTTPKLNVNPSQELLDMILLSLGMIGELIYSVAGLVGLTGDKIWQSLSLVLLICHITRLLQVGLQSCLIYISSKLRIQGDCVLRERQPGKQVITFLLIANIAMFFMNLLETEKAGISETVVNFYGKKSWVFLVRSFSPLTIFYRFHSAVCFAEVWKNVYAWKS